MRNKNLYMNDIICINSVKIGFRSIFKIKSKIGSNLIENYVLLNFNFIYYLLIYEYSFLSQKT